MSRRNKPCFLIIPGMTTGTQQSDEGGGRHYAAAAPYEITNRQAETYQRMASPHMAARKNTEGIENEL